MLSHVKSGAIYHNYSISPNISSSFFDFSSLSLSFRRIMPQFCCIAPWVTAPLPQLCRSARRVYRPSFPSFPEPLRPCRPPLPTRIVRHERTYRMIRAFVSYVTRPRALRYELLTLISSLAAGHGGPSEGGWRSRRGHDASSQGGKRLSVMDVGGWALGSANQYQSLRHAYL